MSTSPTTTDGFIFSANAATASAASRLLGRVGGVHINASKSGVTLRDILNCFVSLQFIVSNASYISEEGRPLSLSVTTWDKDKIASFFEDMACGFVKGIVPTEEERDATLKLVEDLRHDNNFGIHPPTAW